MHSFFKVYKICVDGCLPFRPISSASQTPTHKLVKFLVPVIVSLTIEKYTFKDSFNFVTEIVEKVPRS